jgi:hypothetical protein
MVGNAPRNDVKSAGRDVLTLALCIFLQVVPGIAQSHALKFEKEVGVGWRADKYGWMSFVSFSPDGTMVASDGPATPDDVSGNLAHFVRMWRTRMGNSESAL